MDQNQIDKLVDYMLPKGEAVIWLSPKAQAAIALKVPMSGIPELDAMIREARRLDMATAAMIRIVATGENWEGITANRSFILADALLAASEKERGE